MNRKMSPIVLMFSVLVLASLACQAVSRAVGSDESPTPQTGQASPTKSAKLTQPAKQPTAQPAVSGPQEIRQWAVTAKASSEYGDSTWNAKQATGAPNVNECGDNGLAWASKSPSGLDWIELTYATPVIPTAINIYQSYNPSQVVEVDLIATDGTTYMAWQGSAKQISTCPDLMTITFDEKQEMLVEKVVVIVDQSMLSLGWNEIDAVELVGMAEGGGGGQQAENPVVPPPANQAGPAPTNYTGWMAGPVYQGYLKIIPGQTKADELNSLIGLEGQRSTDSWKPRPDHADTFIFKFGQDNMMAWISVTTDGIVYKKAISVNTYPSDYQLETVTQENYKKLDAIYKRDQAVPYAVMANLLGSPGFLNELTLREDGRMEAHYNWLAPNGDRIIGIFFDEVITGIAGLAYIPK
jgi:hypothetical protein